MNSVQKNILWVVSIIAICVGLWYFRSIVAYILIAAVISIILSPLVNLLHKRVKFRKIHIPRWVATIIALIVGGGVVFGLFFSLTPLIFGKFTELSNVDPSYLAQQIGEPFEEFQKTIIEKFNLPADFSFSASLLAALKEIIQPEFINQMLSNAISMIGSTFIALFSILFITFFFLKEEFLFRNIVLMFTPHKYDDNINRALTSIQLLLKRYFIGILIESTIMFTFVTVVLLLFGMSSSDALFIGIIVGVLNVIPYIGPMIGWCIGVMTGALSPIDGFTLFGTIAIVGGTIITAQLIDNIVLQPFLYSNSVHAHPLEIFIVILLAGSVGGVLGILFAIPMYNVIRVFAKEFFNHIRVVQKLTENI